MRANEQALRQTVQSVAVFAAVTFSDTDPDGEARYAALRQRIGLTLSGQPGEQKVSDIQGELAGVQTALDAAKDRHQQTDGTLAQLLQNVEGAPTEEVAAQILALQTTLQASLQTIRDAAADQSAEVSLSRRWSRACPHKTSSRHVCFSLQSGHGSARAGCPLRANSIDATIRSLHQRLWICENHGRRAKTFFYFSSAKKLPETKPHRAPDHCRYLTS